MKAYLLAAGLGTRLKPYTDKTPKCMMPICGRPLLEIWLQLLAAHGIEQVLINLHHHAGQVRDFLQRYSRRQSLPRIESVYEPVLLGSAGTLWANRDFVAGEDDFLIAYADNLTRVDLTKMIDTHRVFRSMGGVLTMGVFRAPDPAACGIVTCDRQDRIVAFVEKPRRPPGNLANGGIYLAGSQLWDRFPSPDQTGEPFDLGHHVLPQLVGEMFAYKINEFLMDIGTPENWALAQQKWKALDNKTHRPMR